MLASLLLLATLSSGIQTQNPVATQNSSLAWDYNDADIAAFSVTNFTVCIDNQPTPACTQVPLTGGVPSTTTQGLKSYSFKFPALLSGPHTVAVQACTVGGNQCSSGSILAFTVQIVITNPVNLRLVK